ARLERNERLAHRFDQLVGLERDRASVLTKHPRREKIDIREIRLEHAVRDGAGIRERALDPPCRVARDGDTCTADGLADLPRPRDAVLLDVEVGRDPEVALPARCEPDV